MSSSLFVCRGLLDAALFPSITWDNCLWAGRNLELLGLSCSTCLQRWQAFLAAFSRGLWHFSKGPLKCQATVQECAGW